MVNVMNTMQTYTYRVIVMMALVFLSTLFISSQASAQRRRVIVERGWNAHVVQLPRGHYPVIVGGRNYFYSDGFFYRGGRRGYVMVPAPLGARVRVLPFGSVGFRIGPLAYYYCDGAYYQYFPGENVYVVVQKPNGAPSTDSNDTEDKAMLTDGTTLSGVFMGATADSVQFQVNGEIRSIPITGISSINFAPSTFNNSGQK